jgi:hypothetical protein
MKTVDDQRKEEYLTAVLASQLAGPPSPRPPLPSTSANNFAGRLRPKKHTYVIAPMV